VRLNDLLAVGGVALISAGLYLAWKPLALLFLGAAMLVAAVLMTKHPKAES